MPPKETHEIKMMYGVYAGGREEPIVIDEIKDLTLEEAEPILEEHNFVKVTRCKDCVYWEQATDNSGNCNRAFEITAYGSDFCSYGERRENDER